MGSLTPAEAQVTRSSAGGCRVDEVRYECREVVGDERWRRFRNRTPPPTGASRRVTPDSTSANGQPSAPVSAPSVDGRSPTTSPDEPNRAPDQIDHRTFGLPGDFRSSSGGGGDGGRDRSRPGDHAAGHGIGRVEIGGHEPGAAVYGSRRAIELAEVESAIKAYDDRGRRLALDGP